MHGGEGGGGGMNPGFYMGNNRGPGPNMDNMRMGGPPQNQWRGGGNRRGGKRGELCYFAFSFLTPVIFKAKLGQVKSMP